MGPLRAAVAAVGAILLTSEPLLAEPVLRGTSQELPTIQAAKPEHLEALQDAAPADPPTPPKPDLPPISAYLQTIDWLLDTANAKYQAAIAVGALAAGLMMVFNGEVSFKYLVVLGTFLCVGAFTHDELSKVWPAHWCIAGGLEAGFLGASIIHQGYKGAKILLGTALGMFCGLRFLHWTVVHGFQAVATHPGVEFFVCTACMILGIMAFTKLHNAFLSVLAPVLGGLLVASSIDFGVAFICTLLDQRKGYDIKVKGTSWVEFFKVLMNSESPNVGVIGHRSFVVAGQEHTVDVDRCLGYALWGVIALVGIIIHRKKRNQSKIVGLNAMGLQEPLMKNA